MMLLSDLDLTELTELIVSYGEQKYRAKQLMRHIVAYDSFDEYTDIPKKLIKKLRSDGWVERALKENTRVKSSDGAIRYLFETVDGDLIESVYLPHGYGNSVCVSCQVGCGMGCSFCASGIYGLKRNLSPGEILSQILFIERDMKPNGGISKLVMMGSGEPLANYANTLKFIRLVNSPDGINIGMRQISLSTCGIAENIRALADDGVSCTLSLSLHAATDDKRREIMRIAQSYSVDELVSALKYYFDKTGRRVIIEYILIDGFNNNECDAMALKKLLFGLCCHVNLIPLNPTENFAKKPPDRKRAYAFCQKLTDLGLSASVRRSMGSDVAGACGQLKNRTAERRARAKKV